MGTWLFLSLWILLISWLAAWSWSLAVALIALGLSRGAEPNAAVLHVSLVTAVGSGIFWAAWIPRTEGSEWALLIAVAGSAAAAFLSFAAL